MPRRFFAIDLEAGLNQDFSFSGNEILLIPGEQKVAERFGDNPIPTYLYTAEEHANLKSVGLVQNCAEAVPDKAGLYLTLVENDDGFRRWKTVKWDGIEWLLPMNEDSKVTHWATIPKMPKGS